MSGRYGALWAFLAFILLGLAVLGQAPGCGRWDEACPRGCPRDCGCDGGAGCYCTGATPLDRHLRTLP